MKDFYHGIAALLLFGLILAIGTIVLINKLHDTPVMKDNDYQQAEAQPSMSNNISDDGLQVSVDYENEVSIPNENATNIPDEDVISDTKENAASEPDEKTVSDSDNNAITVSDDNANIVPKENTVSKDNVDTSITESSSYLLVGDSRLVGLNQTTNISSDSRYDVKAKNGEGYSWLTKQTLDSSKTIVFMLGVNDLYKVQSYASYYNNLIANGYSIIFVTVAPVDEVKEHKNGYEVLNADIDSFNDTIKREVNCTILDLNMYMKQHGFDTADGVHYTAETYQLIYGFLTDNLK